VCDSESLLHKEELELFSLLPSIAWLLILNTDGSAISSVVEPLTINFGSGSDFGKVSGSVSSSSSVSGSGSGSKSGTGSRTYLAVVFLFFYKTQPFLMLEAALFPKKLSPHFWFFIFCIPFYVGSGPKSGSWTRTRTGMHDSFGYDKPKKLWFLRFRSSTLQILDMPKEF
jgi:hypothetical protein